MHNAFFTGCCVLLPPDVDGVLCRSNACYPELLSEQKSSLPDGPQNILKHLEITWVYMLYYFAGI